MTNDSFQLYLRKRLDQVGKELSRPGITPGERAALKAQKDLLDSFARLKGAALRRARRDYERRLRRMGRPLETIAP